MANHGFPKTRYRLFLLAAAVAFLAGCLPAAGVPPADTPKPGAAPTITPVPTRTPADTKMPVTAPATAEPTFTATPFPSQAPTLQPTSTILLPTQTDILRVALVVGNIARCDLTFQDEKYLLGTGCEDVQRLLAVPVGDTIWLKILMTDAHKELPTVLPVEGSVAPKLSRGYVGWQFSQSGDHIVQARIQDRSQGLDAVVEIKISAY